MTGSLLRLLDNGASNAHDDAANDNHGHGLSSARNGRAGNEDYHVREKDGAHVKGKRQLASKRHDAEVGQPVREADPGEEVDVPKGLVQPRLDVGDIADVVAWEKRLSI